MLETIHIQQFALIEELTLDLAAGLNVLTGETGAGKSIVIDAVSFLLGHRGGASVVRSGATRARVEGRFDVRRCAAARHILAEAELILEDEPDTLLLVREMTASGKNTVRINGQLGTLSQARALGDVLLDIHGQHEHESLLRPNQHLHLVDRLGSEATLQAVYAAFDRWKGLHEELQQLEQLDRDRARQMEWLQHEVDEIERARLVPGEEEELEKERSRLVHAEKIRHRLFEAEQALSSAEPAASTLIGAACRALDALSSITDEYHAMVESLRNMTLDLEEMARDVRRAASDTLDDPTRLDEVQARLETIVSLKRKYGATIEAILEYGQESSRKLTLLQNAESRRTELGQALQQAREILDTACAALSKERRAVSARLEKAVVQELQALEMPGTQFSIEWRTVEPSRDGVDRAEFMLSPNPGEPLRPLHRIASGGELARMMLALKTVFAAVDEMPTVIFDEIDTGLGGRAAAAVAERLRALGRSHQVICVTHQPVIAASASTHWHLSKQFESDRTRTHASRLEGEKRVAEMARMLSGKSASKASLAAARELLTTR